MDLTDPAMPFFLKVLLWIAAGLGAVTAIIASLAVLRNQLRDSKIIRRIAGELTRNGGDTVKDLVTRAARDAKQAADDSKKALDLSVMLDKRTRKYGKRLAEATRKQEALEQRQIEMDKRLDRFIGHIDRNDLHVSQLKKEVEDRLRDNGEDEAREDRQ